MADNSDDGHLYYCKKNPKTMKSIDSCTRVQLGSLGDYVSPQMGITPLTAQGDGNKMHYLYRHRDDRHDDRRHDRRQMPISSTGVYTPPTNVASRASFISSC